MKYEQKIKLPFTLFNLVWKSPRLCVLSSTAMAENVAFNSCNDATFLSPDFSVTLTKPNHFQVLCQLLCLQLRFCHLSNQLV